MTIQQIARLVRDEERRMGIKLRLKLDMKSITRQIREEREDQDRAHEIWRQAEEQGR